MLTERLRFSKIEFRMCEEGSVPDDTTVKVDGFSVDISGAVRCQEQCQCRNVRGLLEHRLPIES